MFDYEDFENNTKNIIIEDLNNVLNFKTVSELITCLVYLKYNIKREIIRLGFAGSVASTLIFKFNRLRDRLSSSETFIEEVREYRAENVSNYVVSCFFDNMFEEAIKEFYKKESEFFKEEIAYLLRGLLLDYDDYSFKIKEKFSRMILRFIEIYYKIDKSECLNIIDSLMNSLNGTCKTYFFETLEKINKDITSIDIDEIRDFLKLKYN